MADVSAHEALSGICGSVSLTAWIVVLLPQLVENYHNGHADGISLTFLGTWFIGDILNLAGALRAHLLGTIIALAVYFCFADILLIGQCLYYQKLHRQDPSTEPLLPKDDTASSKTAAICKNIVAVLGVCLFGTAAWIIAWKTHLWHSNTSQERDTQMGALILGYGSALCYLGARMPQIVKNARQKSCEGLSLLFFILSVLGNLTFGCSILLHSTETEYLKTNFPWLLGSLGTMVQDFVIFGQFQAYANRAQALAEPVAEDSE